MEYMLLLSEVDHMTATAQRLDGSKLNKMHVVPCHVDIKICINPTF